MCQPQPKANISVAKQRALEGIGPRGFGQLQIIRHCCIRKSWRYLHILYARALIVQGSGIQRQGVFHDKTGQETGTGHVARLTA